MSIDLPPELDWVARLAVGMDWPKGDEDKLRSLGAAWDDAARQLTALSREIDPATSGVLHSVGGAVADEFSNFTQQLKSNLPDMAEAAGQLGELGRSTGLQVEYAKYMILAQLVWLASEIAQLAFWAPEAIPALVTGVRAIVKMLLRRLLVSIATGFAFMVGMDAVIQSIQFLKGDRTKWDTFATLQAVEGGAIGGAIGGVFSGVGSAFAPKFAGSLIGKGVIGGASGLVTTEAMSQIFGGEYDMGSALTSGIIGAMGGERGRRRFGGDHTKIHTPDIHLPSEADVHLPKAPSEGGARLPVLEDFGTGGLGSGGGLDEGGGPGHGRGETAGTDGPGESGETGTGGIRTTDSDSTRRDGAGGTGTGTGSDGNVSERTGSPRGSTIATVGIGDRTTGNETARPTTESTGPGAVGPVVHGTGEGIPHVAATESMGPVRHGTDERIPHVAATESMGPVRHGTDERIPHVAATESMGPVSGGARGTTSTPHVPTESSPRPHEAAPPTAPEPTRHFGGLPGFETTSDGRGGGAHALGTPGEGVPGTAHASRQGAGTPTRRPDAAAHNPTTATATQGTGPASAGRTTPPATSGGLFHSVTEQSRVPRTDTPNSSRTGEPVAPVDAAAHSQGSGAVTGTERDPGSVTDRPRTQSTVVDQPQAPATATNQPRTTGAGADRPPTESEGALRTTPVVGSPSAPRPATRSTPHQEPATVPQSRPSAVTSDGPGRSPA
ncbi:hypothetical protein, partial [Streptomyces sp. MUM 2J]|uniref:WXG100-like domain-containing protein n=1 Tax=Streptomyces sp. MUM 2J TaxID=2791987 RepID=UPI0035ABDA52|nr:hypothetical protein [Streptomyces sp. MUM 2J]